MTLGPMEVEKGELPLEPPGSKYEKVKTLGSPLYRKG